MGLRYRVGIFGICILSVAPMVVSGALFAVSRARADVVGPKGTSTSPSTSGTTSSGTTGTSTTGTATTASQPQPGAPVILPKNPPLVPAPAGAAPTQPAPAAPAPGTAPPQAQPPPPP